MLVGYARLSTTEQDAETQAQIQALRAADVEKVFTEKAAPDAERRTLEIAMDYCRNGDTFVVPSLERLAGSVQHLGEIIENLEDRNVALRVLDLGLDSSTLPGKMALSMMAAVSRFEQDIAEETRQAAPSKAKPAAKKSEPAPIGLTEQVTDEEFAAIAASA